MKYLFKLSPAQKHWLDFLWVMIKKEIQARYKHATLGFLWIVLNPLSQMLVMGFVFQFFVPVKVDNYFLFLFSGLLPWNFFSQSLTKATPSFFYERNLIKKSKFPRESIVLSIIFSNLFHFLVALSLLVVVLIFNQVIVNQINLSVLIWYLINMIWLIPAIVLLVVFTIGLSLLTASLNVRFRDVNFIVQLGVMLWFYATPIIYSLNLLPEFLWPFFYLNPLTLVAELFQYALIRMPLTLTSFSWVSLLITIYIFYLGWKIFFRESKNFDDWF